MSEKANPQITLNDPNVRRTPTLAGAPSALRIVEMVDEITGEKRFKLIADKAKFGDEEKEIFLSQIATHGRLGTAARAAGVTTATIRRHVKNDPDFAMLMQESVECYRDRLIEHHQKLVFEGVKKLTYDREGNLISETTEYPIRLIELELKKHDDGYRDKKEVTMEHRGGVMVAPAEVGSVEEWEKAFGSAKDVTPVSEVVEAELADERED